MTHRFSTVWSCLVACVAALVVTSCAQTTGDKQVPDLSDRKVNVVVTTNVIGDLVREVGGDAVDLTVLMGPGVDPHLYKASEGDVQRMSSADLVFYNGLHLEGKMTEIFAQMQRRSAVFTSAIAEEAVPESLRVGSEEYASNYDPHVWFDVSLWARASRHVGDVLARVDTANAEGYRQRAAAYADSLGRLDAYVTEQMNRVPDEQRVLVTSHDAFRYLGAAYDIEVRGLQGISTTSEAGTADVQDLADFIVERRIPAIFVETSVSPRGIRAVREAVRAKGFEVQIGGTLYGDALGDRGTPEGTYPGAVRHNVQTIVSGLLAQPS